jgi:hypothetical protein
MKLVIFCGVDLIYGGTIRQFGLLRVWINVGFRLPRFQCRYISVKEN